MKKNFLLVLTLFVMLFSACERVSERFLGFLGKEKQEDIFIIEKIEDYRKLYYKTFYTGVLFENYNMLFFDENWNYKGISKEEFQKVNVEDIEKEFLDYKQLYDSIQANINNSPKYNFEEDVKNIIELSYIIKEKLLETKKYFASSEVLNIRTEKLNREYFELLDKYGYYLKEFTLKFEEFNHNYQKEFFQQLISKGSIIEDKKEIFKAAAKIFISALYNVDTLEHIIENEEIFKRLKDLGKLLEAAKIDIEIEVDKYDENKEKNKYLFFMALEELTKKSKIIIEFLEKKADKNIILSELGSFIAIYGRNIEEGQFELKINIDD